MSKTCLIIAGGEFEDFTQLLISKNIKYDYVIACDKGLLYAQKLNIKPDLCIGDFDSYEGELPENIETIKFPWEKDDTDMVCALKEAYKRGFSKFVIVTALGNRFDHSFGNIQACKAYSQKAVDVSILSIKEEIYFLTNSKIILPPKKDFSLSVFSLTDQCMGVYEKNTKWTLSNASLSSDYPLGLSNQWLTDGSNAEISVESGTLLLVLSKIQ